MRQQNKRYHNRSRHNNNNTSSNNNQKAVNPLRHSFDSNGPDIRIRGNALQIYEKYMNVARETRGDNERILRENLKQHAEHYYRMVNDETDYFRSKTDADKFSDEFEEASQKADSSDNSRNEQEQKNAEETSEASSDEPCVETTPEKPRNAPRSNRKQAAPKEGVERAPRRFEAILPPPIEEKSL